MSSVAVRVTLGIALAFAGVLGLVELFVEGANLGLWWLGVQLGASAVFWVAFATDRGSWWAAIPAAVLTATGVRSLLEYTPLIANWREFVFLTIASLGFWAVAATRKRRWWAIIPAGMLVTLGVTDLADRLLTDQAGGIVFFVGASLTFVVLAIAPGGACPALGLVPRDRARDRRRDRGPLGGGPRRGGGGVVADPRGRRGHRDRHQRAALATLGAVARRT